MSKSFLACNATASAAWIVPLTPLVARRIALFLETPMTARWYLEDVHARDAACNLLRAAVTLRPAWIGHAAATAYSEMQSHGKGNGSDGSCRELAEGTRAVPTAAAEQDIEHPTTFEMQWGDATMR